MEDGPVQVAQLSFPVLSGNDLNQVAQVGQVTVLAFGFITFPTSLSPESQDIDDTEALDDPSSFQSFRSVRSREGGAFAK
jgi:hypothetical protein